MTVVVWLALVTAGALPFRWSGITPTFTDAFCMLIGTPFKTESNP